MTTSDDRPRCRCGCPLNDDDGVCLRCATEAHFAPGTKDTDDNE